MRPHFVSETAQLLGFGRDLPGLVCAQVQHTHAGRRTIRPTRRRVWYGLAHNISLRRPGDATGYHLCVFSLCSETDAISDWDTISRMSYGRSLRNPSPSVLGTHPLNL